MRGILKDKIVRRILNLLLVVIVFLSIFQFIGIKFLLHSSNNCYTLSSSLNPNENFGSFRKSIIPYNDPSFHSTDLFCMEKTIELSSILIGKTVLNSYSRDKDIPANRIIIRAIVTEDPGITLREIQRKTGLAMGVIQYHLNYLENNGIITMKLGRSKHFYPRESNFSLKEKIWLAVLRNDNVKKIVEFFTSNGNLCNKQKDIVDSTGLNKVMVSYYIRQLEQYDIIKRYHRNIQITDDFLAISRKLGYFNGS